GVENTPFLIEEHYNLSQLWDGDWRILNTDSSARRIIARVETLNGNVFSGISELYIWDSEFERWNFISTGTFTLTLP
ncbi:hypothetical protein RZS08_31805, partial [Arthrospira platensis SPKY1]|nr:hypothetical protein [Arthrospira platensis SPKY1]